MSCIYFHSPNGTAEVRGSERAYMGVLCSSLLVTSLGLDRAYPSDAARFRRMLPPDHYAQHGDDVEFLRRFQTWVTVGGEERFGVVTKTTPFIAAVNTATAIGGDALKLIARLHAQCEIHAYVEGPHRAWLASIIEHGRKANLLRSNQGWESVVALLRKGSDDAVVTSYSVCASFPPSCDHTHTESPVAGSVFAIS